MIFRRGALGLGVVALCLLAGNASAGEVITGVRTWKFTDGSELRAGLYTAKDGQAVLAVRNRKPPIPFGKFIPEHQKILEAVVSGEIELLEDPRSGVNDYTSVNTEDPDWVLGHAMVGIARTWTRKDGKSAKGSLVNISDDEIHLLIGEAIWKMMITDLGPADLAYLEGIKRGTEPATPARVRLNGQFASLPVPGGKPGHMDLWVDGTRFIDSTPVLNFESALAKAKEEISSKMAVTAWSLVAVEESRVELSESLVKRLPKPPPAEWRRCYEITFQIAERKKDEAMRLFPDNADGYGRCYFVYFDDGLPPQKRFVPPN